MKRKSWSFWLFVALCFPAVAQADWQTHSTGLRYFLPAQGTATPLAGGMIARASNGFSVWVLPLSEAQLAASAGPIEGLLAPTVAQARVLSRTVNLLAIPNVVGRWTHGTGSFERRSVHWHARVQRIGTRHGILVVSFSPRAALVQTEAELLDLALQSGYVPESPDVVRYAGTSAITIAGLRPQTVNGVALFEVRGTGAQRTVVLPDLDTNACTFQARALPSGSIRFESDQACQYHRVGLTMTLVGAQLDFTGTNMAFLASGRMSFMSRRAGLVGVGLLSFNWRVQAARP